MALTEHPAAPLVIRVAEAKDEAALAHLAELDSARAPSGATLIAESHERPVAALSLADGQAVADPFVPTSEIIELLRFRARQLTPRLAPRAPLPRRLSMRIQQARFQRSIAC